MKNGFLWLTQYRGYRVMDAAGLAWVVSDGCASSVVDRSSEWSRIVW